MTDFQRGPVSPGQPSAWDNAAESVEPPFSLPEDDVIDAPAVVITTPVKVKEQDSYRQPERDYYSEAPVSAPVQTRRKRPPRYEDDEPVPQQQLPRSGSGCADLITAIFLLMTIGVCAYTSLLLANPASPLNPLPPPPTIFIKVLATPLPTLTPTETFTPLPATNTPPATDTPTPSNTPTATDTPTVTPTSVIPDVIQPTVTETISVDPGQPVITSQFTPSPFPFTVEPIQYVAHKGQDACSWQSIAGTVVDMSGKPIKGLALHVTGANGNIDEHHWTGTEPSYGEGGFEVFLGAIPREDQYSIQLLGRTGEPISDIVTVQTHTACDENVVFIQFVQNHGY
jgi:hypothetical protein